MSEVHIEYIALSELQRWPRNPKMHDLAVLERSVGRFGFVNPVLIDERSGRLVVGHGRLEILQRMKDEGQAPPGRIKVEGGEWFIPVIRGIRFNSDQEAEAYLVADNRTSELGGWDDAELARLLQELDEELMGTAGFTDDELDALLASLDDFESDLPADPGPQMDRAAELQEKWKTECGQLWEIPSQTVPGRSHRLLCGDSTNPEDVARLMDGQRAVLFATDPPYLVGYDGTNHPHAWGEPDKNKDWGESYHDWDSPNQGEALYDGFVRVAQEVAIAKDAAWYCWHASRCQAMLDLGQVQADEIKVKKQRGAAWMVLAMMVSTRLWLGGVVGLHRDKSLIRELAGQVRQWALCRPILLAVDGFAAYVKAFQQVFRSPYKGGKGGRPRLYVWEEVALCKSSSGICRTR